MLIKSGIFKDYDIRAIIGDELDMEGVKRIAEASIALFNPKNVSIGRDMRLSGNKIFKILSRTYLQNGIDVIDLGLITSDMSYFASDKGGYDMSIMISASHNPPEYNGLKFVLKGARAVSGDSGIYDIRDWALSKKSLKVSQKQEGRLTKKDYYQEWIDYCLSLVDVQKIRPFKIVIDAGNGMASVLFEKLKGKTPFEIVPLFFKLDGNFPNHIPNPLKPENIVDLQKRVKRENADFGVGFDGDGDRIAFVDEAGKYITGTVLTAMLAEILLRKHPGETILYNAVCGRVVPETIKKYKGKPIRTRVGHTLIKEAMRKHNGLFCGEHSGHYFYKATSFAESALLTLLLITQLLTLRKQKLSQIVEELDKYPSIPETNFEVADKKGVMKKIEEKYKDAAGSIDWLDGLSIWFKDYWANVRPSNTQPLLRLNLEADDKETLKEKKTEFITTIEKLGGKLSKD